MIASTSDGRQIRLDARIGSEQGERGVLVDRRLSVLPLELGYDEPRRTNESAVRPTALAPLAEHRVVGVPVVDAGEVRDLALEVALADERDT